LPEDKVDVRVGLWENFTGEVLTKLKDPIRQLELVPRCKLQKNPQDPTERTEEKSMVGRVSIVAWSRGQLGID
jgi:hypothetical protein